MRRRGTGAGRGFGAIAGAGASGVLLLVGSGCAGPTLDQSSRLTIGDMRLIVDETVQQFAASPFLAERTEASEPIVITFTRMENATTDVITRSELWYLAQSVAGKVASDRGLRRGKNVMMVIPAERLRDAKRRGTVTAESGEGRQPTHTMAARITSITRSEGDRRRDFYQAEYTVLRLRDGVIEWQGLVEFEREALGRSFN